MLQITIKPRSNKTVKIKSGLKHRAKKVITNIKTLGLFLVILVFSLSYSPSMNSEAMINESKPYRIKITTREEISKIDMDLESEVSDYINKNSFRSKLNAKRFIKNCYEMEFDLILALSQAHIESNFGTTGIASRTNSVFNVGTFDDGTILYRYGHPDLSLPPYIELVKSKYLLNDIKSSEDLLKPMAFVNYKGKRYASLESYEERVKGIFDKIIEQTPIDSLWNLSRSPQIEYSRGFWNSVDAFNKMAVN